MTCDELGHEILNTTYNKVTVIEDYISSTTEKDLKVLPQLTLGYNANRFLGLEVRAASDGNNKLYEAFLKPKVTAGFLTMYGIGGYQIADFYDKKDGALYGGGLGINLGSLSINLDATNMVSTEDYKANLGLVYNF